MPSVAMVLHGFIGSAAALVPTDYFAVHQRGLETER